jgi:hypothetical protein
MHCGIRKPVKEGSPQEGASAGVVGRWHILGAEPDVVGMHQGNYALENTVLLGVARAASTKGMDDTHIVRSQDETGLLVA